MTTTLGAGGGALRRVAQHPAGARDAAVEDQLLQAAARQFRQLALQGAVEPDAGILGGDRDLDPLSAAGAAVAGTSRQAPHSRTAA